MNILNQMHVIPPDTRDITREVFDENGDLIIHPASFYASKTPNERALVCVLNGLYGLPTLELVDWLREFIGNRSALEIGAGNGALARALGIAAVDNRMQERPEIIERYNRQGQGLVRYGSNIETLEAIKGIKKYKPQVVLGVFITHKYNPREHWRGGNMYGPDVREILKNCEQYVHIGNENTHASHVLWKYPHVLHFRPWLYTRCTSYGRDFIGVWNSLALERR